MRKFLSLILSLSIVLSSMLGLFTTYSSAEGTTYYTYTQDFEDYKLTADGGIGFFNTTAYAMVDKTTDSTASVYSGNKAIQRLAVSNAHPLIRFIDDSSKNLTAGKNYRVYIYTTAAASSKTSFWTGGNTANTVDANGTKTDAKYVHKAFNPAVANTESSYSRGLIYKVGTAGDFNILAGTVTAEKENLYFYNTNAAVSYSDDVIIGEIIPADKITASTSDSTAGTASVENKIAEFNTATETKNYITAGVQYAVGETAVYTATANEGYEFTYWKDAQGNVVSTSPTYEVLLDATLSKATNLTAHFNKIDLNKKPNNWEYKTVIYNDFESAGQIHNKTYVSVVDVNGNKVMCYNNTNTTAKGGAIAVNPSAILPSFQELGLADGDTFGVSFMGQNFTPDSDPWFQVYSFLEQDKTSGSLEGLGGITIYAEDYQGYTKYYTYDGETAAQSAKGIVLYFNKASSKAYIDDVMIYPTTKLTLTGDKKYIIWSDDEFKYAGEGDTYDPANARVGDWYSFTLAGITANVTYGGEVVEPNENGVYDIKIAKGKTLNIEKTGVAKLQTTLDDGVTEDTVKVLAIGNSYTNDATAMLPEIAMAEGKDLRIAQATIGGSTLEKHYTNLTENNASYTFQYNDKGSDTYNKLSSKITLETALYTTDWDYVTIQQASPASSRDYATYFAPYLETVIGAIKEYAPTAQIMVHETWAYSEVKSQHFGANILEKESYSQIDMYEDIVANYKQLAADVCEIAEQSECKIIPSGTAFRIARSQLHDAMLNRDNNPGHANFLGRLAGAYCYYRTIFGEKFESYDPANSSHRWSFRFYPINMPYDHDGDADTGNISDTVDITNDQITAYIPTILASVDKAFDYKGQDKEIAIPDAAKTVKAKNGGVSIRLKSETKGQALRFKSSVPVAERGKAYDDGYKLVEYGSLVILSDVLNNAALVHDGKYGANEKAPVKAIAYNVADNTDIIFGDDGTNLVFTVAVNNISIANYGMDITVRAYAVYKNETTGDEYYIYSDNTQTGSIFSVMETIETTYNAYVEDNSSLPEGMNATKLEEDYNALIVNVSEEVKTAFAQWKN
ncbi:MAG: DUF4886 domain-containing protein [Clostridia bacterium]|nr:DUF4886 domain-containing protein [Clostridia bacterium]